MDTRKLINHSSKDHDAGGKECCSGQSCELEYLGIAAEAPKVVKLVADINITGIGEA